MSYFDSPLLQAIPQPALIARDGRVVAFNAAAAQLFDDLAQDRPLPDCLVCQPATTALIVVGGSGWLMTASPLEDGVFYLLRATQSGEISHTQLDGVLRCLRQQLAQLLLTAQLIGRDLNEGPAADRLGGMNRTLCQMLRLTEQLDLLRSLGCDTTAFHPLTLDLAGLCREVCAAAEGLLTDVDLHLAFESPLSSLLVSGDSALLEKLLLELIANAARAATPGSRLTLSLAKRSNRAVLTLSGDGGQDDGRSLVLLLTGDAPNHHIPQPGEGAGLGLALAQRIVTLHQGTLMMERRNGIHVTVALPLCPSNAPLSVRAPRTDYAGGFAPALVELSDLLPDSAFAHLDVE
ncbi:MAG: HAMP domain-containing histidine kinase [Ruminococcaceae bacterium]|nr:HAMP domain-containing histidine kinase [Oscillospiraceae bacterium]